MSKENKKNIEAAAAVEGGRRPTGAAAAGDVADGRRWTVRRKQEVVLRLLRGESADALSREYGVETHLLEQWRERALGGMESALKTRPTDPLADELAAAHKKIGELSMTNELLEIKIDRMEGRPVPFGRKRSKK